MSRPLEQLQLDFAAALADPAAATAAIASALAGAGNIGERLSLYRGSVTGAWEKALANAFPVVRSLVGEEFFMALARAFGGRHPSISGDLNCFGERFADFVAAFEHAQSLPYLADVARLDWCLHRAYYAGDATALTRGYISALPPGELLAGRFDVHPACAWIESAFAVASIWLAHQAQGGITWMQDVNLGEYALVVRPQWRAEALRSSAGEIAALAQLRRGGDMESAIAAGLDADAAFDFPKALVRWLDYAILVG